MNLNKILSATAVLLVIGLFLLGSCGNRKDRKGSSHNEHVVEGIKSGEGELRDLSGLDACRLMIFMDNGKKLQPINWPEGSSIPAVGSRLAIKYLILEDMVSICMAEDFNVDIVEYRVIKGPGKPAKKDCVDILDPYRVDWMVELVEGLEPYSITRYNYEDGWIYYLQCGTINYVYDCQGTYICEVPGRSYNDCAKMISELEGAKIIWVRNEKD